MLVRSEHGMVILAALEKDLARLDALNRSVETANKMSAAFYLARFLKEASEAGYKPTYAYLATGIEPVPPVAVPGLWARILSALAGTVRQSPPR